MSTNNCGIDMFPHRLSFKLPEFTRLAWVSDPARQVWEPRIRRISAMLSELEVKTISEGLRDACLRLVPVESFDNFLKSNLDNGIEVLRLMDVAKLGTYASSLEDCSQGNPTAFWCAVGKGDAAASLRDAFVANDNATIGTLLGYPSCCIEFFKNVWCDAGMIDTTWPMAARTQKTRVLHSNGLEIRDTSLCAIHLRWLGVRAVFHLPCAYDCMSSQIIANQHCELAREVGFENEVDWLEQMTQWPAEWSTLHGITEVRTPVVKLIARGDSTSRKYVVKYAGSSRKLPIHSAAGVVFPFSLPALPVITSSRSFESGLGNPITVSSQDCPFESEPWYAEDNGFRTGYAMKRAHAPIVERVRKLYQESPALQKSPRVLDLGCGNGVLLHRISKLNPTIVPVGVDFDHGKISRARMVFGNQRSEFHVDDIFVWSANEKPPEMYLAILMLGRLLEVPEYLRAKFIERVAPSLEHVLVYAYEDYVREHGSLRMMAERLGITLLDEDTEYVSLANFKGVGSSASSSSIQEVLLEEFE